MAATELLSVSVLTADEASPKFNIQLGTARGSTHTLEMAIGGSTVFTVTGITVTPQNQGYIPITLTAENRAVILAAMPNSASVTATYTLKTYTSNVLMGSSTKTAKVITTEENSGPSFWGVSLVDTNSATETLSPDNFIQNASLLSATFRDVTSRNEATISKYIVTVGEKTVENSTSPVAFGIIPLSGEVTITATVQDSRGYTSSLSYTVDVVPYTPLSITSYNAHRVNNVETAINLSFEGKFSPLTVEGTDLNTITGAAYKYKESGGSYGSLVSISGLTVGTSTFSYTNSSFLSLADNKAYTLYIEVSDRLTTTYIELLISRGQPLMRITRTGVCINTNEQKGTLHVNGSIFQQSFPIMALRHFLNENYDLDDIDSQGLYPNPSGTGATSANHYPVAAKGLLEVFDIMNSRIIQRYTDFDNLDVYLRKYDGSAWSAWKQI